jgi:hypothetical protein
MERAAGGDTMGHWKLNQKTRALAHRVPRARHLSMLAVAALALTLSACDWTQQLKGVPGTWRLFAAMG